ncbi:potassium transporter [Pasteurellaceae bacterium RH1A]|nr:potassium transporter [Pasteurellaceae bacterium RH1A]
MAAEGAHELVKVVTLLGAAVIAVPLFKRLGLGSVLGYLAAGLVIGPFGLGLFQDPQTIIHTAELGVVMFLFIIGLEMKPAHLWELRGQIFGLGTMQVITAAVILTLIGIMAGFPWQIAFVAASGFVLTSTAIVMQVLSERGEMSAPRGQKMVSILLFEDLLIVPLLAVVTFIAPTDPNVPAKTTAEILTEIGIAGGSLVALLVIGHYLINPFFKMLAKSKAREVMTAAALLVVLGSALLMEVGGLSMAMGAFVAGVLLSESSFRHQLEVDIEPFRGLLLGLFFLGVGMALDLHVVAENWVLIASTLFAFMTAKFICIYVIARLLKACHTEALDRAVLMAQGGEFAFVLFAAAAKSGVIDSTVNANMTAVVVLSMALTPVMIILLKRFGSKVGFDLDGVEHIEDAEELRGNVLIVGFGRVGQIASQAPIAYGSEITIIDNNPDVIRGAKQYGFKVYYGDGTRLDVLRNAGVTNVDCVIVCVNDPKAAVQIVDNCRHLCQKVKIVARAYDRKNELELVKADADFTLRETFDASIRLGNKALKALGVDEEEITVIEEQVRQRDAERFALEQAGDEFEGRALLFGNIKQH